MSELTAHKQAAREKSYFGFWVYIMTDCVLFATLFATYAVLKNNTAGGPGAAELFSLPFVLTETMILLASSFTSGLGLLAAKRGNKKQMFTWLMITFLLGLSFIGMELYEFNHLVQSSHSWRSSAFLSAFFTLVGTHGVHITVGLVWLATLLVQIGKNGLSSTKIYKLTMFSMFWHFLDIVWIFIFSFVYLMGAAG